MKIVRPKINKLPSLAFLHRLTDQTGIIQHSRHNVPDMRFGYCLDDNARALIVVSWYQKLAPKNHDLQKLSSIYLSYINLCQRDDGWMRNFLTFDHQFTDEIGSEDSFGRAIWGLGVACENLTDHSQIKLAEELLLSSCMRIKELRFPRAAAYAVCGLSAYLQKNPDFEQGKEIVRNSLEKIKAKFDQESSVNWPWFEDKLSYSNALIPLALMAGGDAIQDKSIIDLGVKSLDWIITQTEIKLENGEIVAAPIGCNGWFKKNGERAFFDQQPIDVALTILAVKEAYKLTHQKKYIEIAKRWFNWFAGKNMTGVVMADEQNGSCFDGLCSNKVNQNRGAESTIMYLLAALKMAER